MAKLSFIQKISQWILFGTSWALNPFFSGIIKPEEEFSYP